MSRQSKKANVTLALDENILDKIRKEADDEGVSINSRINSILTRYELFLKTAIDQRSVIMPRHSFSQILEVMDEEKFLKILNNVATDIMPAVLAHNNIPPTMENVIQYCFETTFIWGGMLTRFSHHRDDEGNLSMVLEHDYDIKWSRLIGTSLSHFINVTTGNSAKPRFYPKTVVLTVFDRSLA